MQHELQVRLDADPALSKIGVLGVDPGTMITGLQRIAPWVIRVLIYKVIYPVLLYLNPDNGVVRRTSDAAGDVLEAAFGVGEHGEVLKDGYFYYKKPLETSEESRDAEKRALVWTETVKLAGLNDGDSALIHWQ